MGCSRLKIYVRICAFLATALVPSGARVSAEDIQLTSSSAARILQQIPRSKIDQAHAECFEDDPFPSARKCGRCHQEHYREWSVSSHAYAILSPVFNAMSNRLNQLTSGTTGDFCIRCHTPVGMALDESIAMSAMDRHPTSQEGVTCVVCHRVNQEWGKINARQALVPGDIHQPNYGPTGGATLEQILANPDKWGTMKTRADPKVPGRDVHRAIIPFFQLQTAGFCGACHDVLAPNGLRLEDAFSEFKTSPAARHEQRNCQDCHMGVVPGQPSGYACQPAAKIGYLDTPARKHSNHMMVGPDYSIIHPGIFPHNPHAVRPERAGLEDPGLATMREWLSFDYKAGWGTDEFEENIPAQSAFPEPWHDPARRYKAREILEQQFKLLQEATAKRYQLLTTGYRLGNIVTQRSDHRGIRFKVKVSNGTSAHAVPTGFDAERVVFLRVLVVDRDGKVVFLSGDLDPNGDLRDDHSAYVHHGRLPRDRSLFNLQSRFLVRNVRGSESDKVLNVPFSPDPLPYVRPAVRPVTVLGRPATARKHKQGLEVGGHRWAEYEIKDDQLTGKGPYRVTVQLVAGMVPINLVREISSAGFDYGMSAREVADGVLGGHQVLHERRVLIDLHRNNSRVAK